MDNLKLLNVDFVDFSFNHRPINKDEKPNITINQEYKFQGPTASNKLLLHTETTITGENDYLKLVMHSTSIFDIKDRTKYDESYNKMMIELSYPYIRNKIIQLTEQPLIAPIVLPLFVDNVVKKDKDIIA